MTTNKTKTIDLEQFAQGRITLLAAKPKGADARMALNIDDLDKSDDVVDVLIPDYIITLTPSFFLGLFSKSLDYLGEEKFFQKYHFKNAKFSIQQQIKSGVDDWKNAQ